MDRNTYTFGHHRFQYRYRYRYNNNNKRTAQQTNTARNNQEIANQTQHNRASGSNVTTDNAFETKRPITRHFFIRDEAQTPKRRKIEINKEVNTNDIYDDESRPKSSREVQYTNNEDESSASDNDTITIGSSEDQDELDDEVHFNTTNIYCFPRGSLCKKDRKKITYNRDINKMCPKCYTKIKYDGEYAHIFEKVNYSPR